MLAAVEREQAGCKDVARLIAVADAFALLLACQRPRQDHALCSLLGLMRGRFPRVRPLSRLVVGGSMSSQISQNCCVADSAHMAPAGF